MFYLKKVKNIKNKKVNVSRSDGGEEDDIEALHQQLGKVKSLNQKNVIKIFKKNRLTDLLI